MFWDAAVDISAISGFLFHLHAAEGHLSGFSTRTCACLGFFTVHVSECSFQSAFGGIRWRGYGIHIDHFVLLAFTRLFKFTGGSAPRHRSIAYAMKLPIIILLQPEDRDRSFLPVLRAWLNLRETADPAEMATAAPKEAWQRCAVSFLPCSVFGVRAGRAVEGLPTSGRAAPRIRAGQRGCQRECNIVLFLVQRTSDK